MPPSIQGERAGLAGTAGCCGRAPVVGPWDALVSKDVHVVGPGWVGDVHRASLEEAGDEAGADAEGARTGERLQSCDTALMGDGKGLVRRALLLYDGRAEVKRTVFRQQYCNALHGD